MFRFKEFRRLKTIYGKIVNLPRKCWIELSYITIFCAGENQKRVLEWGWICYRPPNIYSARALRGTDWSVCLCPSGMRPPAVVRRGGAGLLPAGRPHLVQELQRPPHPGPLCQNLHRLLTRAQHRLRQHSPPSRSTYCTDRTGQDRTSSSFVLSSEILLCFLC